MLKEDVEVFKNGRECKTSQSANLKDGSLLRCVKGLHEKHGCHLIIRGGGVKLWNFLDSRDFLNKKSRPNVKIIMMVVDHISGEANPVVNFPHS